ncbi:peptide-methionine (S)-S-oxide reductase [Paenibacillus sp. 1_12]|uniref:peptide-methionine (S)-S-oxide reductase MsrA n=1 Tax=Paenibacillus sp. 1_12 TaxID=1566278 RepID=UPI0008E4B74F|nr:peptide-methionine (S)-S-oxide reductase MsrA [Paenibacillus sp. 1_12]SFM22904.1 peptide-methionine (S)-S-oxide reductase [Paenibacillus sp. 1_12]
MDNQELHNIANEPFFSENTIQTITLGMGCFWSPESLFGQLPGVIRTRVGYAGGTAIDPTYRQIGDHTEMLQIDFDSEKITFEELLDVFWNNHNPININDYKGRQYRSLLLYADEQQKEAIQRVIRKRKALGKGEPETEVASYSQFYLAEDKHQKYYLKRFPNAIEKLSTLYASEEDMNNSTLAARLNGLAKGFTNMEHIKNEIREWPATPDSRELMINLISQIRW